MCLITEQKKPIVTDKDIIVYKQLLVKKDPYKDTVTIRSIYKKLFTWEFNNIYNVLLRYEQYYILNGDHCAADGKAYEHYGTIDPCKLTVVLNGFHSYHTIDRAKHRLVHDYGMENRIMYLAIVPKGSEVFYDATGLITSNNIILTDKIIRHDNISEQTKKFSENIQIQDCAS